MKKQCRENEINQFNEINENNIRFHARRYRHVLIFQIRIDTNIINYITDMFYNSGLTLYTGDLIITKWV